MAKRSPKSATHRSERVEANIIRSSAAEYLTFVASSGKGGVEAVYADENVWLSQKMIGVLYDVATSTVNYHLSKVFADNELAENSVIRNFRITAADGKSYYTRHYNLATVIAVGYKVNTERAVQFRKWATGVIESFTIKGFVMDDERLKNDGSILSKKYFEEQLERIREIRLSERKIYRNEALLCNRPEQASLGDPRSNRSRTHHVACRCHERTHGSHNMDRCATW